EPSGTCGMGALSSLLTFCEVEMLTTASSRPSARSATDSGPAGFTSALAGTASGPAPSERLTASASAAWATLDLVFKAMFGILFRLLGRGQSLPAMRRKSVGRDDLPSSLARIGHGLQARVSRAADEPYHQHAKRDGDEPGGAQLVLRNLRQHLRHAPQNRRGQCVHQPLDDQEERDPRQEIGHGS